MKSESTYHFQKIRKHVSLSRFPTIFYEFPWAQQKGFQKFKKQPIKSDQDFNRLIWHERTNCLNLKLHKNILQDFTCWILFDKSPLKGECRKIQHKDEKIELKICLVTGHEAHWSSFTVLNVLEKAKPEHFQTNWSVLIVCSVHLNLTDYFHGNKQRTLLKMTSSDQKILANWIAYAWDEISLKEKCHSIA